MTVAELVKEAHDNARAKGFWDGPRDNVAEHIALVATEVVEFEDAAFGLYAEVEQLEEIADIVIRIFDLCGRTGVELPESVFTSLVSRMPMNETSFAHRLYKLLARATQAHRKERHGEFMDLMQAVVVRCAGFVDMRFGAGRLEGAVLCKMEVNQGRPHMHGNLY